MVIVEVWLCGMPDSVSSRRNFVSCAARTRLLRAGGFAARAAGLHLHRATFHTCVLTHDYCASDFQAARSRRPRVPSAATSASVTGTPSTGRGISPSTRMAFGVRVARSTGVNKSTFHSRRKHPRAASVIPDSSGPAGTASDGNCRSAWPESVGCCISAPSTGAQRSGSTAPA